MKKVLVLIFVHLMIVFLISCAAYAQTVDWTALLETGETADTLVQTVSTAAVIDWAAVFSDIMTGAVTALVVFICGAIAYAILRILIPLLPTLVQWLKDKNILWIAKILVTAAEGALGRFVGSAKFAQVVAWFEKRHIVVTDEVKQMIYNAWWQLNKQMIELGLKEATVEEPDDDAENGSAAEEDSTAETAEDSGGDDDPFTDSDQPVAIE